MTCDGDFEGTIFTIVWLNIFWYFFLGENRYLRNAISHSRDSSLTEDGYVPMAPTDDGYVDMDHGANQNKHGMNALAIWNN